MRYAFANASYEVYPSVGWVSASVTHRNRFWLDVLRIR